ncbi:MAG: CoA transferase [Dehalococcoidia bacterium]|nr:CoA transferase [Dehalococcoidia bacterium]
MTLERKGVGVLDHVNVLDLSWVAAGPLCGMIFAYHGAAVVRVESAVRIDVARGSPPSAGHGINKSGYFAAMNLGKYDVCLDLNKPAGLEVTNRLVDWADIVLEGFTPGTMKQWGLDYESLRRRKHDIIMISLTLQGQTGPEATLPGYGLQVQGMSGLASLTGWPDGPPTGVTLAYPDYVVPFFATFAAMAALDQRERTGEGQHVDLGQMEAMINVTGTAIPDYAVNGREQLRAGNRLMAGDAPYTAPHGTYPVQGEDRWIAVATFDDDQWGSLCRALGREDWLSDERFVTQDARCRNDETLDAAIAEETARHDGRELMERLQQAGVPAGVAHDQRGLFDDPQLEHRKHFVPMVHGDWGEFPAEQFGVRLSETPPRIQRPSPLIGEHNEYVMRELLGYSAEEFDRLVAEGAIEFYGAD